MDEVQAYGTATVKEPSQRRLYNIETDLFGQQMEKIEAGTIDSEKRTATTYLTTHFPSVREL